jgi:ferredoxin-type protein NapH
MNAKTKTLSRSIFGFGTFKALLLTLPMLLLAGLMLMGSVLGGGLSQDPRLTLATLVVWVGYSTVFFLMLRNGKTHLLRAVLFVLMALGILIGFPVMLVAARGITALTESAVINLETPFCHLVIPMIILPAAVTRTIIFPGSLLTGFASIGSMVVLWLGVSLVMGRGWCSWGCFYGGFDEGFSLIAKKPLIKQVDRKWTYLPWAVLLVIVLTSAITLSPTYCEWLCPFKAVTEYPQVTSTLLAIQTGIFVLLFLGLVVVLPFLTKRRTQCGLFCPFGAVQTLTNKVSVFDVRIDPQKCAHCERCVKGCPTFSLDEHSLETGRPLLSCTKCGQCVDTCPKQAIRYHIKGTSLQANPKTARVLFLYAGFLMLTAIGGQWVALSLYRLLQLVTGGAS